MFPDFILPNTHYSWETTQQANSVVGTKTRGLMSLPSHWTPPYIILTTIAYNKWKYALTSEDRDEFLRGIIHSNSDEIINLLSVYRSKLIVRSSATFETLNDRGLYESSICDCNSDDLIKTINNIWLNTEIHSSLQDREMALIIQVCVSARQSGHLSNERRVSKRSSNWLCEFEPQLNSQLETQKFSINLKHSFIDDTLNCTNVQQLLEKLKLVAAISNTRKHRVHFEWVWDGGHLWIVQCDLEDIKRGTSPGSAWTSIYSTLSTKSPFAFVHEVNAKGQWKKIACVRTFRKCGLPVAPIYVLEDPKIIEQLSNGIVDLGVRADLSWLLQNPLVVRTDVLDSDGGKGFFLPRTDSLQNIEEAFKFLTDTAKSLTSQGVSYNSLCFIAHNYIAATGCAISLSRPTSNRVLIDSTWGLPDGLQYYPHDTFEVGAEGTANISKKIRCKSSYIDIDTNGAWTEKNSGAIFDWKESLSQEQIYEIARISRIISLSLDKAVSIMFFIGVLTATGLPDCLPWFYTYDLPDADRSIDSTKYSGAKINISDYEDLKAVTSIIRTNRYVMQPKLVVRPKLDLIRNADLIKRIAEVAIQYSYAVELQGSILSHAYYILTRENINVSCVEAFYSKPVSRKFGKLVRDLIPVTIEAHGEAAETYQATPSQLVPLLKTKAVEEALELFWTSDDPHLLEELADLVEVINSIAELSGFTLDDVKKAAAMKHEQRGGFKKGYVLVETREVPLISRLKPSSGLFDDVLQIKKRANPINYNSINRIIGRKPKMRGNSFSVSLIPPENLRDRENIKIAFDDEQEFTIRYQEKEIVISLTPLSKIETDVMQLDLFDEE